MADPDQPCTGLPLDHGAIGNGRVIALVAPSTHVDWLCLPRFDSPSVFARLLDAERGGTFAVSPACAQTSTRMQYVRNTNVLQTELRCSDGVFDVFDFAPRIPTGLTVFAPAEIDRLIVPREGAPRLSVVFDPRPAYGSVRPVLVPVDGGIDLSDGTYPLHLRTNIPASYLLNGQPFRLDGPKFLAFSHGSPPAVDSAPAVQHALDLTIAGWRAWAKTCSLPRFADEDVLRSALCLKLHAFTETGAIIAAATTSLPEALGTGRAWDYRYCWLRDAAFVVEALRRLSHLAEGEAFVSFLRDVADSGPLQPVYGVSGEREIEEVTLTELRGYGGAPVRIGNAAWRQTQHDVMGEMVVCLETIACDPRSGIEDAGALLPLVERLVSEAVSASQTLDTGLWEYRTLPARYTFSQALCWVAAARGARLARRFGRNDLASRWESWAEPFRQDVLSRAFNPALGCFTQTLDGQYADASNLLLPALGVINARDPRFLSTLDAYARLLVEDGLMLRYRHADDFGPPTTAFTICSFWWAEALALAGRLDEAIAVFTRVSAHANAVGLFSEDIDPASGRLLGNFPQAYTHVGLVHAAMTIGDLLDSRDGRFRVWT